MDNPTAHVFPRESQAPRRQVMANGEFAEEMQSRPTVCVVGIIWHGISRGASSISPTAIHTSLKPNQKATR